MKLDYVSNTTSGPQSIQGVVTGDVDIGSAFNGAILKRIAAGAPIRAVVVNRFFLGVARARGTTACSSMSSGVDFR